jgi:crotonobetainyl-CoA:carnitine CoA-transferase CaiB-like acyl-CoA transferase
LRALNPRLVFAAISGYGHSGPKAGRGGYDVVAQGEAGLMALTGDPQDGPVRFPTPIADISAGVYAAMSILAALYVRERTGQGQFVDVSLLDSQVTWLANIGANVLNTGQRPPKLGSQHPSITPYQPVRCQDKMIIIAVGTEALWQRFCRVLGAELTLLNNPLYATNQLRNQNRTELIAHIERILAERSAAEWLDQFATNEIPAGPINFPDETLADPHLQARGMIVELEHPLAGLVRSIGSPIHLSDTPPTYRRYPPRLGEHSNEILQELGCSAADIAEMREKGVV